jgi:hypothetical protein
MESPTPPSSPFPPAGTDWRALIALQWQALGLEVLGVGPTRRTPAEIGRDSETLAAVVAWFEAGGNITRAASKLGTSRRLIRNRITRWRRSNPHLLPKADG